MFGFQITSLKKERDSLIQKLQQEGPSDAQRTRGLQRENAQVCFNQSIKPSINHSIRGSVSQSVSKSISQSVSQSVSQC